MPFRLSQVAFRGRNDDGSESAATWKAAQDTNWAQLVEVPLRVRFRMDETGGTAWTNKTFNLRYSLNGGAYTAVAAGQPVVFAASGNFAQGADCTTQLTGGAARPDGAPWFKTPTFTVTRENARTLFPLYFK